MRSESKQQLSLPFVWVSSSAVSAPPINQHFGRGNASRWDDRAWERFTADHATHHRLIKSSIDSSESAAPLFYYRMSSFDDPPAVTMNSTTRSLNAPLYAQIEGQLESLRHGDLQIEAGAIDTALIVLHELQSTDIIPPLLVPQGDDAVVMLWSIRNATYAITITDGELGYIVRQQRQELKKRDSIKIEKFSLPALPFPAG